MDVTYREKVEGLIKLAEAALPPGHPDRRIEEFPCGVWKSTRVAVRMLHMSMNEIDAQIAANKEAEVAAWRTKQMPPTTAAPSVAVGPLVLQKNSTTPLNELPRLTEQAVIPGETRAGLIARREAEAKSFGERFAGRVEAEPEVWRTHVLRDLRTLNPETLKSEEEETFIYDLAAAINGGAGDWQTSARTMRAIFPWGPPTLTEAKNFLIGLQG